jgi:hypothetical protein
MDRATRRAQKERNKARIRKAIVSTWSCGDDPAWVERTVARMANHGKLCSCYMCGNPRRHHGELTMQERRSALQLGPDLRLQGR